MTQVLARIPMAGPDPMDFQLMGNSLEVWLTAFAVSLASLLLLSLARRVLSRRVSAIAARTETRMDDYAASILASSKLFFFLALSVYVGAQPLRLPPLAVTWIDTLAVISLIVQIGVWSDSLLRLWLRHYQERLDEDPGRVTTMKAATVVVRIVLFSIVVLLALDHVPGVQVTALIASLGIGGVAVALATQNVLTDLFASLVISLDQPFVPGDFIVVDDKMGTVERVGLKTTLVRSLSGEQLIFSNSDLLKCRIRNYKRMAERRIAFSIGVTYQTPHEKVAAIPSIIREIVQSQAKARFDRAHFKEFGDSSLNFEAVYWVEVPDYGVYMDVQQAINLALFGRFALEGIEFAYPTQTLFVERES